MAANSKIEWTDATWNPVIGCTKVSDGCNNCYPIKDANRLSGNPNGNLAELYSGLVRSINGRLNWTGVVKTIEERLGQPLRWAAPRKIFVNSMSDLFHESVPFEFIDKVMAVMGLTPQHIYQILTKRPQRMLEYMTGDYLQRALRAAPDLAGRNASWIDWHDPLWLRAYDNVWLGTSVEDQKTADARVSLLAKTPAAVRFLSIEPLLGPVNVRGYLMGGHHPGLCGNCGQGHGFDRCPNYGGIAKTDREWRCDSFKRVDFSIHWVIVGGESGPGARPMHPDWARALRDQCARAAVPFFFKQWGEFLPEDMPDTAHFDWQAGTNDPRVYRFADGKAAIRIGKKKAGALLDGQEWKQFPEATPIGI